MGGITKLIAFVVSIPVLLVVFAQMLDQHADVSSISGAPQSLFDSAPSLLAIAIAAVLVLSFGAVAFFIIRR